MYLLIVTGLSGAGKSNTLRCLEDMGYYCVDNLPIALIDDFIGFCKKNDPPIEKAALVIDSREVSFHSDKYKGFESMESIFANLNQINVSYEILFLDCRDEVLSMRYGETRRRHPLCANVQEGIKLERDLLTGMRDRANYIIDTSSFTIPQFRQKLKATIRESSDAPFFLVVESFGFKRGIPMESDLVFDVRFTPNPFYEASLRPLSGLDQPVYDFVFADPAVTDFLDRLESMLDKLIPLYINQGKTRLMVAIGCTGGRHRSVCCAKELARRMEQKYSTTLIHRDLVTEEEDINLRFGLQERS